MPGILKISSAELKKIFTWILRIIPVSVITGLLVAIFLVALDYFTALRFGFPVLIFFLPVGGLLLAAITRFAGKHAAAGNDQIIDEIHTPKDSVPPLMAPLILFTTLLTHLFGGSAGREGTAIQMGGGTAAWISRKLRLTLAQRPTMMICGMAAGFGAVFGTPLAGAVFAVEVLRVGKIKYNVLGYALLAAVTGDLVCALTGVQHTRYLVEFVPAAGKILPWITPDFLLLIKVIAAAIIFGFVARMFSWTSHVIRVNAAVVIPSLWLRAVVGGLLIVAISYAIGSFDYLGLGVSNPDPSAVTILSSFTAGGADSFSWFWKLLLTAITLGFGFKGGEVTPLFFIGATLGNVIAVHTGSPVDLFAAAGFIAVFAGATNTPVACTLMGVELFGVDNAVFFGVACFAAYLSSGKKGIYGTQRVGDL